MGAGGDEPGGRSGVTARERLESLVENHPLPHVLVAPDDGRVIALNRAAATLLGFEPDDRIEPWPLEVEPQPARRASDDPSAGRQVARLTTRSGEPLHVDVIERSVRWSRGPVRLLVVVGVAPTAARAARLVEQRRQGERMEAIGRLAGGVAHDLNNLLTVIRGHTDLIALAVDEGSDLGDDVARIREAAERASDLARQLLAFARRQVLTPSVVDVNAAVERLRPVLESLLGDGQSLVIGLDPAAGSVRVDPSQLDQVVLNLALNGRDAMPDGGTLLIETASIDVDPLFAALYPPLQPGRCALLAVSDQGVGLTADAREHLFEPFFTTKGGGRGTGLGLATVYGIVRQSMGAISVFSEQGLGTTMRIYLPNVESPPPHGARTGAATPGAGGEAAALLGDGAPCQTDAAAVPGRPGRAAGVPRTLLVVDDEPEVRRLIEAVLRRAGHHVIAAPHAAAALAAIAAQHADPDALVTDVIMPGMTGPELADAIRSDRPGLPVLFISGLVDDTFDAPETWPSRTGFLAKPFSPDGLVAAVEALFPDDEAAPEPGR